MNAFSPVLQVSVYSQHWSFTAAWVKAIGQRLETVVSLVIAFTLVAATALIEASFSIFLKPKETRLCLLLPLRDALLSELALD